MIQLSQNIIKKFKIDFQKINIMWVISFIEIIQNVQTKHHLECSSFIYSIGFCT